MRYGRGWPVVVSGCAILIATISVAFVRRRCRKREGRVRTVRRVPFARRLGKDDGPTLKGVIGRKAGSLEDFRYSAAMKRSDVTWDSATLDKYITDPQAFIPGNRMAFAE